MGVRVELHELPVVVEHLLEVRHGPTLIDAVPREPATQVVVNTSSGHAVEGHLEGAE